MTRHVVLLLNNAFTSDSRSWKLATSLSRAGHRVTVVARAAAALPERETRDGFEVVRIAQPQPLAWLPAPPLPAGAGRPGRRGLRDRVRDTIGRAAQAGRYLLLARQWAARIGAVVPSADIWQSEGLITLPVALRLRAERGGRVVYDSRDVHVESARFARLPGPWRRLLARGERRWARAADAVVTVSEPYADVLRRMLGVEPVIVMNGPVAWTPPDPPVRRFHEQFGLAPSTRVVLSLGAVQPHRGLEELVDAVGLVDDAVLVFVGDGSHRAAVEARAGAARHRDRVFFLPACPPDEILPLNASADVAAMPVQPSTLNHRLNTPTKLFDAMGAGTPVVASDLPGMASIVRAAGNGVLCDPASAADIARAIRAIVDAPPERRAALREAGLRAAREVYGWDRQVQRLLDLYDWLMSVPSGPAAPPRYRRPFHRRLVSSIARRLPVRLDRATVGFRVSLIREGARPWVRRPATSWRDAANRPLKTRQEADDAVAAVRKAGLPAHQDHPKNWDFLVALGVILDRVPRDGAVLDAGATQYARLLPWLWLYGYRRLYGIDLVYKRPVRRASIRYEGMDLTATTFSDASFDAITCLSVIEHGVPLEAYVREMARLLKPGGLLVTSTDFWCEPIDTAGREAYGVPVHIFTPAEVESLVALAADVGLVPTGAVDLTCAERVVHWARTGLDYTFLNLVFEKVRSPSKPGPSSP